MFVLLKNLGKPLDNDLEIWNDPKKSIYSPTYWLILRGVVSHHFLALKFWIVGNLDWDNMNLLFSRNAQDCTCLILLYQSGMLLGWVPMACTCASGQWHLYRWHWANLDQSSNELTTWSTALQSLPNFWFWEWHKCHRAPLSQVITHTVYRLCFWVLGFIQSANKVVL